MPSTHLSGGKFTDSHTSIIEAAFAPISSISKLACVQKVALGFIKALPNGQPSLKFAEESPGSMLIKIRGSRSLQEIRIYTTDIELVKTSLSKFF